MKNTLYIVLEDRSQDLDVVREEHLKQQNMKQDYISRAKSDCPFLSTSIVHANRVIASNKAKKEENNHRQTQMDMWVHVWLRGKYLYQHRPIHMSKLEVQLNVTNPKMN